MKENKLILSALPKTWIIDIDGTILKHNGYIIDGIDTPLKSSVDFISKIPNTDKIILITARTEKYKKDTIMFLDQQNIRYDEIIFDMPIGERILINDRKPSGLEMSYAINIDRDEGINYTIIYDMEK